jgi:hypothetical protein
MGAGILASCLDQWEINIHDSGHRVVSPFAFYGGASNNYIMMGRDIGWGTTFIEAAQSFRAPIFYDSNDTNYYVDPNSNSRLLNLGLGVTPDIRLSVSGEAHVTSYLFMGGTAGLATSWSARMISSGGTTYINTILLKLTE